MGGRIESCEVRFGTDPGDRGNAGAGSGGSSSMLRICFLVVGLLLVGRSGHA